MRLKTCMVVLGILMSLVGAATPALADGPNVYIVKVGDTLGSIARRHNTTIQALIRANGLNNPNHLYPGQELRLSSSTAAASNTGRTTAGATAQTHTVQRGDTLALIARRYGVAVAALTAANPGVDPMRLRIGQTLALPGGATQSLVTVAPTSSTTGLIPTRITAPRIGLDTTVIPVGWRMVWANGRQQSEWTVADYAAGWHQNSALVGQAGNTVISGHHNIKGEVFRWVVNLAEGDLINVTAANGTTVSYRVAQKMILADRDQPFEVRARNAQWIAPTNDTRLTLVTCWPYTDNTHRVIVVAYPTK